MSVGRGADVGSGPFLGAEGDPPVDCSGEEEEDKVGELEVLDSASRRLCSCGKMIAIGCVISEDA